MRVIDNVKVDDWANTAPTWGGYGTSALVPEMLRLFDSPLVVPTVAMKTDFQSTGNPTLHRYSWGIQSYSMINSFPQKVT